MRTTIHFLMDIENENYKYRMTSIAGNWFRIGNSEFYSAVLTPNEVASLALGVFVMLLDAKNVNVVSFYDRETYQPDHSGQIAITGSRRENHIFPEATVITVHSNDVGDKFDRLYIREGTLHGEKIYLASFVEDDPRTIVKFEHLMSHEYQNVLPENIITEFDKRYIRAMVIGKTRVEKLYSEEDVRVIIGYEVIDEANQWIYQFIDGVEDHILRKACRQK